MGSEKIADAYDEIADLWRDDRFNNEDGIAQHRRALSFLKGTGYALNVGCGCNTRLNVLMRERGLKVEGVDVSLRMLELLRDSDPEITLYQADIRTWQPVHDYDFITAWDSIWHIPLEQQRPVMRKLMSRSSLREDGVFIFSAGGTETPAEHTDSNMGPEVYYSSLGIPGILRVIEESACICRHLEFDQFPESHLFVIAQKRRA